MEPDHVHVAVDLCDEPITGTVTAPGAPPLRFAGWLELVGLLERARTEMWEGGAADAGS